MEKAREFQKNIYFCFIDYAKAFDCVDHNKLWKILKEMGIPDHLICLLRNLYAGQEATVRTGHGTTDWLQIGKGVRQGCILSPEKAMASHFSTLAWRIPGTGEPGGLPSMRSHRVGHDWSDLAAAAAHASKVMLKILQVRLQQYVNCELLDVQAGFRKGRGMRDQIANICWTIEKAREFQKNIYFCFTD